MKLLGIVTLWLLSCKSDLNSYACFPSSDVAQHHIAAGILHSHCRQKFHWFWWKLCVQIGGSVQ